MKKNIKYILALAVAPMMLASCDDMLNKHPQATLSPETFFTNESEMMSFSNSFYTISRARGFIMKIATTISESTSSARFVTAG